MVQGGSLGFGVRRARDGRGVVLSGNGGGKPSVRLVRSRTWCYVMGVGVGVGVCVFGGWRGRGLGSRLHCAECARVCLSAGSWLLVHPQTVEVQHLHPIQATSKQPGTAAHASRFSAPRDSQEQGNLQGRQNQQARSGRAAGSVSVTGMEGWGMTGARPKSNLQSARPVSRSPVGIGPFCLRRRVGA